MLQFWSIDSVTVAFGPDPDSCGMHGLAALLCLPPIRRVAGLLRPCAVSGANAWPWRPITIRDGETRWSRPQRIGDLV